MTLEKPNHKDHDESMESEEHAAEFKKEGVPLSDEDWEHEEKEDDEIVDHIDKVVDESLEHLAEKEKEEEEGEDESE